MKPQASVGTAAAAAGEQVQMSAVPALVFWALPILLAIDYLGLAYQWPILRVTKLATVLAWGTFFIVAAKGGLRLTLSSRQGQLLLALLGLAASSIVYAIVRSYVPVNVRHQADYVALFTVTAAVVDRRSRVRTLAVVGTLVIIALVARNVGPLTSGIRAGSMRAGAFMGDGNDFAWGLLTLMALPMFLVFGRQPIVLRLLGMAGLAAGTFGVVGTQSRGATLAVVFASLYYLLAESRRRLLGIVLLTVGTVGGLAVAPDTYLNRLTSTDVETDTSAQGRLRAWQAAINMAVDYPLGVGAGNFNSAYGRFYMPEDDGSYGSRRWISAHSIYFKVLGESGFPGLFLVLAVLATNFRENRRSLKFAREHAGRAEIEDRWPAALNFALVAYAVAGTFLGGIAYPHLYFLSGLAVSCRRMTTDRGSLPGTDAAQPAVRQITIHPRLALPRSPVPALRRTHVRT